MTAELVMMGALVGGPMTGEPLGGEALVRGGMVGPGGDVVVIGSTGSNIATGSKIARSRRSGL